MTNERFSEEFTILATFDPGTFLLRFHTDSGIAPSEESESRQVSGYEIIQNNLVSTTAHEFAHFVQGCATAAGAREFFLSLDLAQHGLHLLATAAENCEGTLTVPILANTRMYNASQLFRESLGSYLLIARSCVLYIGGQMARRENLQPSTDGSWLRVEEGVRIFNARVAVPLFFADLSIVCREPRLVLLGSLHLSEAFAKCIEMVQCHLTGEPGDAADPAGVPRRADASHFRLGNPYFLVHWIYGNLIGALPSDAGEGASMEELCAMIDLSLMLDPIVTASTLDQQGEFGAFWSQPSHRLDFTPMHGFMMLLPIFGAHYRELPRLGQGWNQEQVTRFQNALLEKAGFSLSVLDLTRAVLVWIEQAFQLENFQNSFVFPTLANEYKRTFTSFLRWRADTLNGGAVLEDFLTDAARLYEFVLSAVPAFAVGPLIFSPKGEVRPGEGIGVDIANLHQHRNVVQGLVSGDMPCPLHIDRPRGCAVPPHDLCRRLPSEPSGLDRCTRETVLNSILYNIGVSRLVWEPRP